jgi:acetyl-CoA C-acetyltransferase
MGEAFIVDAVRTPRGIGKVGKGALAEIHPQQLAATVLKAIAKRNDLNTAEVDDIIWGTSTQRGKQAMDMGRMAALDAGYSVKASGMTLDRFCGSGITSVNIAAASIMTGMEDVVIAGGTEMMSYTASLADPNSPPTLMDAGNMRLRARHPQTHQGVCADAIATLAPSKAAISRRALCRSTRKTVRWRWTMKNFRGRRRHSRGCRSSSRRLRRWPSFRSTKLGPRWEVSCVRSIRI